MSKAQNIYDDPDFFDGYKKLRANRYSANNLEEKPALFSLSPDLHGKAVWISPKKCWRLRQPSIPILNLSVQT